MQKDRIALKVISFAGASLLVAAFAWTGCSNNSSPQSYSLDWKQPGLNSLYVETHFHGSLAIGQQGSEDGSIEVTAIGTFEGKPNAVTLGSGIEYIAFESNGDYSVLDSAFGYSQADWQRFPTGKGSPIMQSTDTIYAPDAIRFSDSTRVHKDYTRTYVDIEDISDYQHNHTYGTFKIHEVCIEDDSVVKFNQPATPKITTFNTDYWIAPTIGWIIKDSTCDGKNWTSKILDGCTVY